jgi:hypothetical protein
MLKPFAPPVPGERLLLLPIDRPKSRIVRGFIECLMAWR